MIIKLAESGVKAADNIDDSDMETSKMLDCLNDEELATLNEYLDRIIKSYQDQFPDEDFEERRKTIDAFMMQHGRRHGFGIHGKWHNDHFNHRSYHDHSFFGGL